MVSQYKTQVFVYKKKDRGEADRTFTCFSEDFGKIDIYAKAIRKINSKLKSGIDIFYLSDIEFVQGKKKTLIEAILINKFPEIIKTPEKFIIAKKIAKLLDNFIKGEQHDYEIFNLLKETFEKLNNLLNYKPEKLQLIYLSFVWNFFAVLGYTPQLSNCAHCHNKLDEKKIYFSNKDGGTICQNCAKINKESKIVASEIIKILRIIIKNDWNMLLKLRIDIITQKELNNISKNYYLYLLASHSFKK
jgi:DNA repair protein RecO (recombination protein O)